MTGKPDGRSGRGGLHPWEPDEKGKVAYACAGRAARSALSKASAIMLTPNDWRTLGAIVSLTATWSKLEDEQTIEQLAELANVKPRTIRRSLERLAEHGVIERDSRRSRKPTVLQLPLAAEDEHARLATLDGHSNEDHARLATQDGQSRQPPTGHENTPDWPPQPSRLATQSGQPPRTEERDTGLSGVSLSENGVPACGNDSNGAAGSSAKGSATGANEKTTTRARSYVHDVGWMLGAALNDDLRERFPTLTDDDVIGLLEEASDISAQEATT